MKKPFVFISYSSKEADSANLVHSYLEGNGIPCWIASQNIQGGESFAEAIFDAIEECSAFVMIASAASDYSMHVSNELSLALGNRKTIIPFRIQEFTPSKKNRYLLQHAQWIDAFEDTNKALKNLLAAVQKALPKQKVEKTATPPPRTPVITTNTTVDDNTPSLTRDEIVNVLLERIEKYPYCLKSRTRG